MYPFLNPFLIPAPQHSPEQYESFTVVLRASRQFECSLSFWTVYNLCDAKVFLAKASLTDHADHTDQAELQNDPALPLLLPQPNLQFD
jgi:hypothetical protein